MLELIITVWTSCSQRRRQKSGIVCSWWMFFSQVHCIHYHSLLYPYLHDILHDKYIFFYLWVLAQDEFWQWEESGNPAGVDVVGTLLIIIQNHHDYRGHNNYFHDHQLSLWSPLSLINMIITTWSSRRGNLTLVESIGRKSKLWFLSWFNAAVAAFHMIFMMIDHTFVSFWSFFTSSDKAADVDLVMNISFLIPNKSIHLSF